MKRLFLSLVALCSLLVFVSCLSSQQQQNMERITFQTSDNVTIVGNFVTVPKAQSVVLLLHMMPATKESFTPLQNMLAEAHMASLAIDLRGHGESTLREPQGDIKEHLNYQKFQDADHQKSRLDVDAALAFLASKGFPKSAVSVVGASIGANLTLDLLAREKEIKKGVLLSPGLDYRGVLTEPAARKVDDSQKIFIVATPGDTYSADSSKKLVEILGPQKSQLLLYENGSEHGTAIWQAHPELISQIVNFL